MFYCNKCGDKHGYPDSIGKSVGKCEMCGVMDKCNDVPSSLLPMPKKQIDPMTGLNADENV